MACFIVPTVEAIATTVITRVLKSKEKKSEQIKVNNNLVIEEEPAKVSFHTKLGWLSNMLWGGSALLAFEHIWHGEVVPWFPFLTGANDPSQAMEIFHEMSTVGLSMSVAVTAIWGIMVLVSNCIEKKYNNVDKNEENCA